MFWMRGAQDYGINFFFSDHFFYSIISLYSILGGKIFCSFRVAALYGHQRTFIYLLQSFGMQVGYFAAAYYCHSQFTVHTMALILLSSDLFLYCIND